MPHTAVAASPDTLSRSRLPIVARQPTWDFSDVTERFFFDGNSLKSTFMVAMSCTFPPGEREFIRSVRLHMDQIDDPKLRADVKEFSAQEGQHALQHKLLNDVFDELGYAATEVVQAFEAIEDEWAEERSDAERLAVTVVMEHITAVMAHHMLSRPDVYASLPGSIRDMMVWHSMEELEHKSVAFDVYAQAVGDNARLRRRLLQQLVEFPRAIGAFQRLLLDRLGHRPTFRERAEMARFLFGKDGVVAGVLPRYLAFMKPGFHPWNEDDSHLVQVAKARTALA